MKKVVLKLLDKITGLAITTLLKSPKLRSVTTPSSILIIRPGGIGDAALLLPAVHVLKKTYPRAFIDILAEKRNGTLFSLSTSIQHVFRYDKPMELLSVLKKDYDVVIDTEQWHRLSAVVARLTKAQMSIGFVTNERKKLFTHLVEYSHDDYEIRSFLNLLTPLLGNKAVVVEGPFLEIPPILTEKAKSLLAPMKCSRIVALFPGSSINERKWGGERFHQIAMLLSEQGYGIVVVGGNDDIIDGERVTGGLPNSINFCAKLSLPETAAILKKSSLLITSDSGLMHIGCGLGISIVALFGPGREKKWAPRGGDCIVINKHLPCSPCTTFGYTQKCKRNAECMKQIKAEEVFAAAMVLLGKK